MQSNNQLKVALSQLNSSEEVERFSQNFQRDGYEIKDLIKLLNESPINITASWALSKLAKNRPALFSSQYIKQLVLILAVSEKQAIKRNIWRSLNNLNIPKKSHEPIIHQAFTLLEINKDDTAVKVHAMSILYKLINSNKELCKALDEILKINLSKGSKGYQSRASKIIKAINQQLKFN